MFVFNHMFTICQYMSLRPASALCKWCNIFARHSPVHRGAVVRPPEEHPSSSAKTGSRAENQGVRWFWSRSRRVSTNPKSRFGFKIPKSKLSQPFSGAPKNNSALSCLCRTEPIRGTWWSTKWWWTRWKTLWVRNDRGGKPAASRIGLKKSPNLSCLPRREAADAENRHRPTLIPPSTPQTARGGWDVTVLLSKRTGRTEFVPQQGAAQHLSPPSIWLGSIHPSFSLSLTHTCLKNPPFYISYTKERRSSVGLFWSSAEAL